MTQMGFDLALHGARQADPDTSWAAAFARLGGKATDRRAVLVALCLAPDGLTDFELGALVQRQQTSAGKRRGELRDMGLVQDSGLRRPAPSGASAIVWVVTSMGRRAEQALDSPGGA